MALARPSGSRSCVNVNPELRSRNEGEAKECRELLHASPELQDFLLEFHALNSVTSRLTTTFGALPSHPLLTAPRGRHGDDHRPFAQQNVREDSSAVKTFAEFRTQDATAP